MTCGFERETCALYAEASDWYLSLFVDPRRWTVGFHREAPCCKWWLMAGPIELCRSWTDADEYPWADDDTA